jgi:hypothetical protein
MPFLLDPDAGKEEIAGAINYLLSNLAQTKSVNPNTGAITTSITGIVGYLYRYLHIRYADSYNGQVNFSNVPTNRTYYGVYNSESASESTDYNDYLWKPFNFGVTDFIWYNVSGGRQIVLFEGSARPFANYFVDNGSAIDLDMLTMQTIDDTSVSIDVIGTVNNLLDQFKLEPQSQEAVISLSLPAELATSSPVVNVGTLSASWVNQTTNKVFASPNGSTGTPSFRSLVSTDIPALSYAPQTSGTSILYGNGSGGFSNVLIGANLTFISGTLAGTGGGGGGGITISTYNISTTPHNETATANIVNLLCDTTTTSITVNLPTASGNTAIISIKKVASANTLTVDPSGTETIDGGTTAAWTAQYESITVVSNGTNWMII